MLLLFVVVTEGLETLVALRPAAGSQPYVSPAVEAVPMLAGVPEQMVTGGPASETGSGFTTITELAVPAQAPATV